MRTRKFPAIALGIMLLVAEPLAAAVDPTLAPTPEQERATELITRYISNYHYRKTPLDDRLSSATFDRYLESLDPNRLYFLQSDVDALGKYRYALDDHLKDSSAAPAFEIFEVLRQRLDERVAYITDLINRDFNFDLQETYMLDRGEMPWASSRAEVDDLWRRRVKNDILALRLEGEELPAIKDTLSKRYERLSRRTAQFNSNDVYQLFINAYTSSVEPHTSYFSPRNSENFRIRMRLSLEGIGAVLQNENEHTVVRRVVPGGPADATNQLHAEDRIVGVGQGAQGNITDVVGWRLDDVVDLIRGKKGSVVRLQLLPKDAGLAGPTKTITITRDKVKLEEQAAKRSLIEIAAEGESGRTRIGVVELPTFYLDFAGRARGDPDYRSTTRDVRALLDELIAQGIDGLVIDLRGNSGGALSEATALTGLFIESGPVVQVKDASGRLDVNVDPDPGIAYDGPLAVLVDRYSASASEIFAGAIQDYGRGVIIGEPTYGKGTVQNLIDLDRISGRSEAGLGQLKVTIAQFFRVNGDSTQHHGVVPDIVYPTAVNVEKQGERALENALPWASVKPAKFARRDTAAGTLDQVRSRHQGRIQGDAGFSYLIGEAYALKEAQERKEVTLLESQRRLERDQRERNRLERRNRFRTARGLPALSSNDQATDGDGDGDDGDDAAGDVLLTEAAHILADVIDTERRASTKLQRAGSTPQPDFVAR